MSDSPLMMKLAFYSWLGLLLITLGTFTAGLLGHFVTLIAAPWLGLGTQAAIHAAIPVLLTAVKFVTVPLLLVLAPFARRHPTFRSWTNWSRARFRQLEQILRIPWSLAKARFLRAKSIFLRREGVKSGSPADEVEGKGEKSSAKKPLKSSTLLLSGGESQTRAMENARSRAADLAHGLKTPPTVLIAEAARLRANGEPEIAPERSPIWRRCAKGGRRMILSGRFLRGVLIVWALAALAVGLMALLLDLDVAANWIWAAGTVPVIAALGVSITRDLAAGRMGVDAVALISMTAALILNANLAAVVVAVMYAGGTVLEDFAVARAERDLRSLADRAPRIAHRRRDDAVEDVAVDAVRQGDVVLVRAGEIVPVDGVLLSTSAALDESALTGEPLPAIHHAGDGLRSGAVNAGETFEMQATATAGESTYAGIVRLVTAAQTAKAPFIRMADKYALLLLPITLVVAGGAWIASGDALRGLAVLVASTPCPLILAAPVAFIAGISRAARQGILIKGGGPLEALARVHTVLFDKTGTLTVGGARLVAIETAPGENADEVLRLAASLEQASQHIVAAAIVSTARARGLRLEIPKAVKESLGSGIEGSIGGEHVRAGSASLIFGSHRRDEWAIRALRRASWRSALCVFVAKGDRVLGALLLADELRRETPRALQALRAAGVKRMVMVTGDRAEAAETISAALDLDAVLSDRSPSEKVEAVATEQSLKPTMMVGDGINDAPALAAAGVGIAMGARGATASSEAADVVILVDRLDRAAEAVKIARRTRAIARQSIVAGMALSGIAMGAAALGQLTPVAAAITQEGIDVLVILNALRALFSGKHSAPRGLAISSEALREDHRTLEKGLNRLREIADALDDADRERAVSLVTEANGIVQKAVVEHEREDEAAIYPRLSAQLPDPSGLAAMSRAHREIQHLARLLQRLSFGLRAEDADRYLIRDAQRVIESIEAIVRLHSAQEEDIYEYAMPA